VSGTTEPGPRTFLFCPESAFGPTNNCIGIGAELVRRGHRVVFAAESSWKGRLEPFGFEEELYDLEPAEGGGGGGSAGQFWKEFVAAVAPELRKPPEEQLAGFMVPTWKALVEGARFAEARLAGIVGAVAPDVVVEDNVVCFPALRRSGPAFVRMVSCNPLELRGPGIPPPYSGLPSGDRSGWEAFRAAYDRTHRPLWEGFSEWVASCGLPPLPDLEFIHSGDRLNLYVYPAELDYVGDRPLGPDWVRLDSCVRRTEGPWTLPPELAQPGPPLVYLSLGSLGGADVDLMRRLVEECSRTPYRFLVSKGPRHQELELADNMWGAEMLPQTRVLEAVEAVVTHGGNNTITEAVHFGLPAVVLPLFWDQHDNAQRVAEKGFGVRLHAYRFAPGELGRAIGQVLGDGALRQRVAAAGEAVRRRDGLGRAVRALETLAREGP